MQACTGDSNKNKLGLTLENTLISMIFTEEVVEVSLIQALIA